MSDDASISDILEAAWDIEKNLLNIECLVGVVGVGKVTRAV